MTTKNYCEICRYELRVGGHCPNEDVWAHKRLKEWKKKEKEMSADEFYWLKRDYQE